MKNKKIFNVSALDTDAFAHSLGLATVPRIRFLQRQKKHQNANHQRQLTENNNKDDEENEESSLSDNDTNQLPINQKSSGFELSSDDDDYEDGDTNALFKVKRKDHEIEDQDNDDDKPLTPINELKSKSTKPLSKAALAKRVIKKRIAANKRTIFDELGTEIIDTAKQLQSDLAKDYDEIDDDCNTGGGIDIERAKNLIRAEDKYDKQRFKMMVKAKHKNAKQKQLKKNGDQEEHDEFGDTDSDEGPDLSWLPDPDKIFNKNKNNVDRQVVNSSSNSEIDSEEELHRPPKKLIELTKKSKKTKRYITDDDIVEKISDKPPAKKMKSLAAKLSVNEAEMIAMKLLGS